MSDIAQQNLDILAKRWPAFAARVRNAQPPDDLQWQGQADSPTLSVNGRRLWSAYDAEAEARLQATTMIPEHAKQAWVYGVGSGDLIRELLRRQRIERVTVVPLNAGIFHLLLHVLDCTDWLADNRVELADPRNQHAIQVPLAVIPPCLQLADPDARALCDHLTQAVIRPFELERQARRAPMRQAHIEANRAYIESDGDVAEAFGSAPGCTAYVCAAGPTLTKTAPWITRHRAEGLLIAVDGALSPLLNIGVVPDYVVSIDDNPKTIVRYFDEDLSACQNSTLVYSPIVDHKAIRLWPGKRLTMYTDEPIYNTLNEIFPKTNLFIGGSVVHPAVDLATRIGATRVLLFGADFGFPDEETHANQKGPTNFYANAAKAGVSAINGRGLRIKTLLSFIGYRLALENYIALHPKVQYLNTSLDGIPIRGTKLQNLTKTRL